MKIISGKTQREAAGSLALVFAIIDAMYDGAKVEEGQLFADAMAECYWLTEVIGGDATDYLHKHGRANHIDKLKAMGFGYDGVAEKHKNWKH